MASAAAGSGVGGVSVCFFGAEAAEGAFSAVFVGALSDVFVDAFSAVLAGAFSAVLAGVLSAAVVLPAVFDDVGPDEVVELLFAVLPVVELFDVEVFDVELLDVEALDVEVLLVDAVGADARAVEDVLSVDVSACVPLVLFFPADAVRAVVVDASDGVFCDVLVAGASSVLALGAAAGSTVRSAMLLRPRFAREEVREAARFLRASRAMSPAMSPRTPRSRS
ncbi:hypothetical protein [Brachybacterium endophyticum]|uniref:hypothetical protein n=1 Tax=Brachybacterium endophyticum TaxID=2182385 RepID=UPI001F0BCF54|nr:hypothetical protein [Brachybacterium endophyticum]